MTAHKCINASIIAHVLLMLCSTMGCNEVSTVGAGGCDGTTSTSRSESSSLTASSNNADSSASSTSSGSGVSFCIPTSRTERCGSSECGYLIDDCGGMYACGVDTNCALQPGTVCTYGMKTTGVCSGIDQCILVPEYEAYCKLPGYQLYACNGSLGPITVRDCAPGTGPATCVGYPGPRLPFLDQPQAKAACCLPCLTL